MSGTAAEEVGQRRDRLPRENRRGRRGGRGAVAFVAGEIVAIGGGEAAVVFGFDLMIGGVGSKGVLGKIPSFVYTRFVVLQNSVL